MSPVETARITELIASLDRSLTLVIVEHDMDVVFTYCPRIIAMHQGAILADGTPEQIRGNPQVTANMLGTTG
jgi:branched-chain amino acid transport system ATP-binding protein